MSSRFRTPLVLTALTLSALVLGCEVRVETPLEPDEPAFDPLREPPLVGPVDEREPPLPPPAPNDWNDERDPPASVEPAYADLPAHRYPSLIVVDGDIVRGELASNASTDAPYSFRAQMTWLAGEREPVDFIRSWIEQWETLSTVGPAGAPVLPRPAARSILLEPWWSASPAGSGSAAASAGSADDPYGGAPVPSPSWEAAPFRLIAIVNRIDLANQPCASGGELRYVYTAVDPLTGDALDMTAILEVPYPGTRPASEWARAWRDLGTLPRGQAYAAGLEQLARDVRAEADPLRVRLLTSEVALASYESPGWEMREFHLQVESDQLALVQAPLERTPRADVDAARLSEHVLSHADAIRSAGVALPEDMQAGAAQLGSPDFRWPVLGVSESLRRAFSVQTCNGCHGGDAEALPFRHIMPVDAPDIAARVSRSLYDPEAPSDELRRRSAALETLAQSVCEPRADAPAYP